MVASKVKWINIVTNNKLKNQENGNIERQVQTS